MESILSRKIFVIDTSVLLYDKKSIEVYMRGTLIPSGGVPKNFTMALTLGKATNQTIPLPEGELKTPQYIHNQFFTLE